MFEQPLVNQLRFTLKNLSSVGFGWKPFLRGELVANHAARVRDPGEHAVTKARSARRHAGRISAPLTA
jgi:hypothetical protein